MPLFSAGLLRKLWSQRASKPTTSKSCLIFPLGIYLVELINWPNLCFYIRDWLISWHSIFIDLFNHVTWDSQSTKFET
jgi:hypothetical protein